MASSSSFSFLNDINLVGDIENVSNGQLQKLENGSHIIILNNGDQTSFNNFDASTLNLLNTEQTAPQAVPIQDQNQIEAIKQETETKPQETIHVQISVSDEKQPPKSEKKKFPFFF